MIFEPSFGPSSTYLGSKASYSNANNSSSDADAIYKCIAKLFEHKLNEANDEAKKAIASAAVSAAAKVGKYTPAEILEYSPSMQTKPDVPAAAVYRPITEYHAFTPPKAIEDSKFSIRVTLVNNGEECSKTAHEVLELDANSTLAQLKKVLRRQFKEISEKGSEGKVNLKGAHISDEKIIKIKAMYGGTNWDFGCADRVPETVLTDDNCSRVLKMLKSWGGHDTLCAIVAAPASE